MHNIHNFIEIDKKKDSSRLFHSDRFLYLFIDNDTYTFGIESHHLDTVTLHQAIETSVIEAIDFS